MGLERFKVHFGTLFSMNAWPNLCRIPHNVLPSATELAVKIVNKSIILLTNSSRQSMNKNQKLTINN